MMKDLMGSGVSLCAEVCWRGEECRCLVVWSGSVLVGPGRSGGERMVGGLSGGAREGTCEVGRRGSWPQLSVIQGWWEGEKNFLDVLSVTWYDLRNTAPNNSESLKGVLNYESY